MKYFENFPLVEYNDVMVQNLLVRVKLLEQAKAQRSIYHPFTVIEGETPEQVAYDYYGSADYTWLIYLVNGIIDPYYDWPMTTEQLEATIKSKYGSLAAAQATILYYKKTPPSFYVSISNPNDFQPAIGFTGDASRYKLITQGTVDLRISPETYAMNPDLSYSAVDAYTDAFDTNEDKRNITLLDRAYTNEMDTELKALLTS